MLDLVKPCTCKRNEPIYVDQTDDTAFGGASDNSIIIITVHSRRMPAESCKRHPESM
jgi:hypothetical protein